MTRTLAAFAAAMLAATGAVATELPAGTGHSLDLGDFTGVVYYTAEREGYRVVATIAEGEAGMPVRFQGMLAEGQAIAISVPGKPGRAERSIEFARAGGRLLVHELSDPDEVVAVRAQAADE